MKTAALILALAAAAGRAAACPVDATDPRSGFPPGFSVCWNQGVQASRVETLAILTNPAAYGLPERPLPIGYVILDYRPPSAAVLLLKEGRLYLVANPLADPAEMRKTLAQQLALAERLQGRFGDFIARTRRAAGMWRAFSRGGDEGFEGLRGCVAPRPSADAERLKSLSRSLEEFGASVGIYSSAFQNKLNGLAEEELVALVDHLDGRVKVNGHGISAPPVELMDPAALQTLENLERRFFNQATQDLPGLLENLPRGEDQSPLFCYSVETGSFAYQRDAPNLLMASIDYRSGVGAGDEQMKNLLGCLQGVFFGPNGYQWTFDLCD